MTADPTDPPVAAAPERTPGRRGRLLGVLACAAAVLFCEALVFRYLFQYGVSNVWRNDGASQHLPGLIYVHEWMTAVLSGRGADYGMWSWRLGLGADTLTTLSYYLADPFALLSLPFPAHLLEYVYEGLFFLRVLCAGLAGYLYLRTMRARRFAAVAGALVYVFSGFVLVISLRHPYFVDAMVWFPLILAGTEQVLARRRWYLLAGALLVAAASNFYFFYQLGIIAALYAVVRWVEITRPGERLRRLVPDALRVGGWYALGTLLASFMLVPMVLAVLTSSRDASQFGMPLFYDARTYLSYVVALVSARVGYNSFTGGFAIIGLLAAGIVFLRRGNSALKAMLVAFAVFTVFPFFGRLFNGFAFPSYRFLFMAGLFLAAATAVVLSDTRPLSRRELAITGAGLAAFAAAAVWSAARLGHPPLVVALPLVIGALTWALFALERLLAGRAGHRRAGTPVGRTRSGPFLRAGVAALLVAGIAGTAAIGYAKRYDPSQLASYLPLGTALDRYRQDPGTLVPSLPTEGLQRVDKQTGALGSGLEVSQNNDPLVQGFAGLDFYWSVMDAGVHEYAKGLGDRSMRFAFDIEGLDDRAVLDTLAGVRYYISPAGGEQYVPYGFARASELGTVTVFENRYALPVGYVYRSAISSGAYAAMSPLDRQQALLQGVVLADGESPALPRITPPSETIDVPYTLTPESRLVWDRAARTISVRRNGASAELTFSPVPDAELYVEMTGVRFTGDTRLPVAVDTGGARKSMRFLPPSESYYWGNETMLVNLGYFPSGTTRARISFLSRKEVTYASLRVIAVPMARFGERVGRLASEGMRDVRAGTDTLSGTVTSAGDGVLFLSIPYSTGWSATVDGEPARIARANVAFSGIPLAGGTHRVELRYATPGLRAGTVMSLLALALALTLAVRTEMRLSAARDRPTADGSAGEGDR